MDDANADSRQGIGSVELAARVLFALEGAGSSLSLNEVAQRCGSQPSKVHRYLVSLGRVGLTTQSTATGRYDLGPASRRLGSEALRRTNDIAIVSEHAVALAEQLGHSVNIAVWGDEGPVIVRWAYGAHYLPLTARVGATLPILESAAGQVFLAYLPRKMTQRALKLNLESSPTVDKSDVERIVLSVRDTGFGSSDGGVVSGLSSVSALVSSASDALPLALTVVLPRAQKLDPEMERVRAALRASVAVIEAELGLG